MMLSDEIFRPLWCFVSLTLVSCSDAQVNTASKTVPTPAASTPIEKLDFLTGYWAGEGLSYDEAGAGTAYYDTEHVRYDVGRNLLLINATGRDERGGVISYQLHTVIYFDQDKGKYIYTPYSGLRAPRPFGCDLVDQKLTCLTGAGNFRLIFQRLKDGRWNEYGERLEGDVWRKTFETKLSAVDLKKGDEPPF